MLVPLLLSPTCAAAAEHTLEDLGSAGDAPAGGAPISLRRPPCPLAFRFAKLLSVAVHQQGKGQAERLGLLAAAAKGHATSEPTQADIGERPQKKYTRATSSAMNIQRSPDSPRLVPVALLPSRELAKQVCPCRDVAPLVRPADLDLQRQQMMQTEQLGEVPSTKIIDGIPAAEDAPGHMASSALLTTGLFYPAAYLHPVRPVEMNKVIALQQLVSELGVADARLGFHPGANRVLCEHRANPARE